MNGFLLINKPSGLSSNQAVQKIKKIFKVAKVGHLGTLDPLASGLLVLALNRATKFSNYFLESDKHYEVEIELGRSTDTDDSEGNVIFESTLYPKKDEIMRKLSESDIPTMVYYKIPVHLQKGYIRYGYKKGDFVVSEDCSERIMSLPMNPYLTIKDQDIIINSLNNLV